MSTELLMVGVAILGVVAPMSGVILLAASGLRKEIDALRSELRSEITQLRGEMNTGFAQLRSEIATVRTELREEIAAVRTELRDEIGELRNDLGKRVVRLEGVFEGVMLARDGTGVSSPSEPKAPRGHSRDGTAPA